MRVFFSFSWPTIDFRIFSNLSNLFWVKRLQKDFFSNLSRVCTLCVISFCKMTGPVARKKPRFLTLHDLTCCVSRRTPASFARKSLTLRCLKVLGIWNQGHPSSTRPEFHQILRTLKKGRAGFTFFLYVSPVEFHAKAGFVWDILGPLLLEYDEGGRVVVR